MEMALRPVVVFELFRLHSPSANGNAMRQFIEQFDDRLLGVLSGFDRLRFRGTMLLLSSEGGMSEYLWRNQVLLKDWDDFVGPLTERVRRSGEQLAAKTPSGRVHYLSTTRISKEEYVQDLLRTQPERDGLVAVLSCVEPCRSFGIRQDAGVGDALCDCRRTLRVRCPLWQSLVP